MSFAAISKELAVTLQQVPDDLKNYTTERYFARPIGQGRTGSLNVYSKNGVNYTDTTGFLTLRNTGYIERDVVLINPGGNFSATASSPIGSLNAIEHNYDIILSTSAPITLYTEKDGLMLHNIASVLYVFQGMHECFETYLRDPDMGVLVFPDVFEEKTEEFKKHPYVIEGILHSSGAYCGSKAALPHKIIENTKKKRSAAALTRPEMELIAYMIVYAMSKSLKNGEQYENNWKNRAQAYCKTMKYANVDVNNVKLFVSSTEMKELYEKAGYFPKFKESIFRVFIQNQAPAHEHIQNILKGTGMSAYALCVQFIEHPDKTLAHIDPQVIVQTSAFMKVHNQLVRDFGADWPYYKLYNPDSTRTATTDFQRLVGAAMEFAMILGNKKSLENLQRSSKAAIPHDLKVKVGRALDSKYLTNSSTMENIARDMVGEDLHGIRFKKVMEDKVYERD